MEMTWQSEMLVAGEARGEVLRLDEPISFWGGVDPATSKVVLAGHPQQGEVIVGKVLVLPNPIGSSSSSAVMLELLYQGRGPRALVLGTRDAILPVGSLVAGLMSWPTCPVVVLKDAPLVTGNRVEIFSDGRVRRLPPAPG